MNPASHLHLMSGLRLDGSIAHPPIRFSDVVLKLRDMSSWPLGLFVAREPAYTTHSIGK
jgi:hypothetical protein